MYDTKAEAVEAFFALLTGELGLGVSGVWEEFFFLARRRFLTKKQTHFFFSLSFPLFFSKPRPKLISRRMHRLDPLGAGQRAQLRGAAGRALGRAAVGRRAEGGLW